MLEIIEYVWNNPKCTRQELVEKFGKYLCEKYLVELCKEKKLYVYYALSPEEKEVADANERIQDEINESKDSNPERAAQLKNKLKYIHYHKVYELHYDYLRQRRGRLNNNSTWVDIESKEWREVEYDPTERVRWKVGADIYEYSPEDSFRKNKQIAHTNSERVSFIKKYRKKNNNQLNIGKFDWDLQTEVLQTYQVAQEVQKVRNKEDVDLTIEDFINSFK